MKYIIDIEDEYTKDWVNETPMCKELCIPISVPNRQRTYHVITGFKLEPYTEPDRKAIENETWDLANRIADMSYEDFISCFEGETEEYVYGLPYHEVKAKYEEWKKQKDEIHIGDEVNFGNRKGVVVRLDGDGVNIVWSDGSTVYMDKDDILKTGEFFGWVGEFMEKIRGEIG